MERIKWLGIVCFILYGPLNGWHLQAQSCAPPVIFTSQATTDTSVNLFWLSFDDPEIGYELTVVPEGMGPDSGDIVTIAPSDRSIQIEGLEPNANYRGFIRSLCLSDTSRWQNHAFLTDIRNHYNCLTHRPIPDDGCESNPLRVAIHVPPSDSGRLGDNVSLSAVNIIIDHPYPADLKLELSNPRGETITLVEYQGTIFDHFGQPGDSSCTNRTQFSNEACISIYDSSPPFIGSFQPDMPLKNLEDGGSPVGEWTLRICDRAADDVGVLEHVSLDFDYSGCPFAPVPQPLAQADNNVVLYQPPTGADSCLLGFRQDIGGPQNPRDSNFNWIILSPEDTLHELVDLDLSASYEYYTYIYCDGQWIGPSCPGQFNTFCGPITSYENWTSAADCRGDCNEDCTVTSELWNIPSSSASWSIKRTLSSYSFTGPNELLFPNSGGAYIVSSGQNLSCDDRFHQLRSICLSVDSTACGFGFYYHMYGAQVGRLQLLLSEDEWATADTLFAKTSNQGPEWQYAFVEQHLLPDGPFQLEFQIVDPVGPFSEIAIGDIFLSGFNPIPLNEQLNYVDEDQDGYGDSNKAIFYCGYILPDTLAQVGTDCNDQDSTINPGMEDLACSGIDENCDGVQNFGLADSLQVSWIESRSPSCPNLSDGWIEINVEGGIPPYDIQWSNGDQDVLIDSLIEGIYSVTVTDSAACQRRSLSIELQPTYELDFSFSILAQPDCFQPNGGSVEVFVSGGNPPYMYEWSNGVQNSLNDSLEAGPFRVTVTDNNDCVFTSDEVNLSARDVFDVSIHEVQSISCPGGSDGELIAQAQGTTELLTYEWNTGDTTRVIDNVDQGWYQVQALDSNDCIVFSDSVFISNPDPIEFSDLEVRSQRCVGQEDGKIRIEVMGGNPPYSYEWETPSGQYIVEQNLHNIGGGSYQLSVTDAKGCTYQPQPILVDSAEGFTFLDAIIAESSCPLSPDGQIDIALTGTLDPLSIQWSDGNSNRLSRTDLLPGFYQLTITNALECKRSLGPFEIPAGQQGLQVEVSATDTLVCGSEGGVAIEAEVEEGQLPFIYHWSNGRQVVRDSRQDSLNVLEVGHYNLTVTDSYGCVGKSDSLKIIGRSPIVLDSLNVQNPTCPNYKNGAIELWASTMAPPLRYFWSSSDRDAQIQDLRSGVYEVILEDESGCIPLRRSITLEGPEPFEISFDTIVQGEEVCILYTIQGGRFPHQVFINGTLEEENPICFPRSEAQVELEVWDDQGCEQAFIVWDQATSAYFQAFNRLQVKVYPNPVRNSLHIQKQTLNPVSFELFHISGQKWDEGVIYGPSFLYPMTPLPAGVYLFRFTNTLGDVEYREIIKH